MFLGVQASCQYKTRDSHVVYTHRHSKAWSYSNFEVEASADYQWLGYNYGILICELKVKSVQV
jgi:hypothetical protein